MIERVLQQLHDLELHARASTDASYQERMIERLRSQLPEQIRRLLDRHMITMDRRLRRHYAEDTAKAQTVFRAMRGKTIRDIHAENLYDSILSTPEYPIHSKAYGISLMNRHLATIAIDRARPEMLETYGWMSVDMNGVKGMVDCTTYQNVTHYLQAVSRFFLNREGQTRCWLETLKVKVIPLAAGGDEYALLLDGEKPMSKGFFDEVAGRYQQEMANSAHLASFLNFDARPIQLEYSMPTEAERVAFFRMSPAEQEARLGGIRESLPDRFIPTCSIGGANFREGTKRAVERGALSLRDGRETFDTARLTMMKHTIELAEARQAENKTETKDCLKLSDPKLHLFLRRNQENRRLDERLHEAELRLAQERARVADLEKNLAALQAICSEQSERIEHLLKQCA